MRNAWAKIRPMPRSKAQLLLPFLERRERLERILRRGIVATTILGLVAIWLAMADGRSALFEKWRRAKWAAGRGIGLEPDRAEVDAYWAGRRTRSEVRTREVYRHEFEKLTPGRRTLLRAAGMGPDDAVVRWGNYDMTLVFSSKVFERDDDGRYYRFRPKTRSILLRQMPLFGLDTCQFFMPDHPEVREYAERAGLAISSVGAQSTNSWGCRGPEPDMDAPVRGLVLGDSFMQGYLLADDETPPMCLQRALRSELGVPTTILNTGILGYGPEHYYHTLRAFGDRFLPRFVVVAVYANDFGDERDVFQGEGDWAEGKYWLEKILWYCQGRNLLCVIAPVPSERQIVGTRRLGDYPGQVSNITGISSELFSNPTDQFVTENLRINLEEGRQGHAQQSALYLGALNDQHLSSRGAALWGRVVGRHLALLLKTRKMVVRPSPAGP